MENESALRVSRRIKCFSVEHDPRGPGLQQKFHESRELGGVGENTIRRNGRANLDHASIPPYQDWRTDFGGRL